MKQEMEMTLTTYKLCSILLAAMRVWERYLAWERVGEVRKRRELRIGDESPLFVVLIPCWIN